jgi:hypothetical protein
MKRTIWISVATALIAAIVAVEGVSGSGDRARSTDGPSGEGWEYLVVQGGTVNLSPSDSGSQRKEPGAFNRESFPLEKNLDKLGAKGWELVAVAGPPGDPVFYLKRKK